MPLDIPKTLLEYFEVINYVDKSIGDFLTGLKKEGLFENSIIVIVGDHEAIRKDIREKIINNHYVKDRITQVPYIPLIIINTNESQILKERISQIDIYPTLLDLFGLCNYNWRGLGRSMLSSDDDQIIKNQGKFSEKFSSASPDYSNKHMDSAWMISDALIKLDYFNKSR